MVLYHVYSEPLFRDYYSTICSRATLFIIALYGLIFIPPAFIAYATDGLWLSVSSYREQPDVLFLNQCIALLGREGGQVSAWGNFPNYTPPPGTVELTDPPNITFTEEDADSDGKRGGLNLSIDFSLNVTSVQLLLFFRVKLNRYSAVDMHSVAYISYSGSSAVSSLWVGGDLELNQREPLPASGQSYKYESLVNTSSDSWLDYQPSTILYNYNQRDLTTALNPEYTVWQYYDTGRGGLTFQADIAYTEQTILYRPTFWERLKWAWVQYLAIALVFWWALTHVKSFVFQNHIIPTIKHHSN